MRRRRGAALVGALILVAGCGSGAGGGGSTTTAAGGGPTSAGTGGAATAAGDLASARVKLTEIGALSVPVAVAVRPGDDALYVALKGGSVRRVSHGQGGGQPAVDPGPVLDLSGQVSSGSEQGLLGLTFSPDGTKLYVDYTDRAGDTQVVEYAYRDGRADDAGRRTVLTVDQPYANHNGGEVAFGPDAKLYVGLGDGGSEGDPDHRGQDPATLLAKILRIDPTPSGDKPYTVPADNPFVSRAGAAPETFAWGLRNPWRFTWDRATKDLWIADVGQNTWEEVDFLAAGSPMGANFGWSGMEGRHAFKGGNPSGGVLPIAEYNHEPGNHCSVTGGYVYRGTTIPALVGTYVYADYCSGTVWGLTRAGGKVADQRQIDVGGTHQVTSFGEDASGEIYLLATDGLFRVLPA